MTGSPSLNAPERPGLHYSWVVAGVALLVLIAAAGIRSIPGVLMLPLEREFGWDRATVSTAVSVNLVLYGAIGPFGAAFAERVGVRRTASVALGLIVVGLALAPFVTAPWQLTLIWGGVVGVATGMMAGWFGAVIATRWFVARRGVVTGIFSANSAAGQLVFLPALAALTEVAGWRSAVAFAAVGVAIAAPLVWAFIRDWPEDVGTTAYGASPTDSGRRPVPTGNPFAGALQTLREVSGSRDFWLLAATFFVCGASTNGLIGTHLISASHDHGIPEVTAASMLAFIGIFDLIGTTGSGWLTDRFDARRLLATYYGLRGLSLLMLPLAYESGTWGLGAFIVFYGLDWVATVPPTIRLATDLFGKHRVGTTYSWIFASHQVGAAAIAWLAGALRVSLGDYQTAFWLSGALCVVATGMALAIRRTPGGVERIFTPPVLRAEPA